MKRIAHYPALAATIICFVALFSGTFLFQPAWSLAADSTDLTPAEKKTEHLMAGLSDEQVRKMLIDELAKDAALDEPDYDRMKGPAFVLARMLNSLSSEHDENENELRDLFTGIPNVLPDLYRVFIKL
jgi:hypothetical protein